MLKTIFYFLLKLILDDIVFICKGIALLGNLLIIPAVKLQTWGLDRIAKIEAKDAAKAVIVTQSSIVTVEPVSAPTNTLPVA